MWLTDQPIFVVDPSSSSFHTPATSKHSQENKYKML
jgi:hypothetical protein